MQKLTAKAPLHPLSPTLEESPSPRVQSPKLSHGHPEPTDNDSINLTQEQGPIPIDTQSDSFSESNSEGSGVRPRLDNNGSVAGADKAGSGTFRSSFRGSSFRDPKTPSPSPSVIQQTETGWTQHSDTDISGSVRAGDSLATQAALEGKHDVTAPKKQSSGEQCVGGGQAETIGSMLDSTVFETADQMRSKVGQVAAPSGETIFSETPFHDYPHSGSFGYESFHKLATEPNLDKKGCPTPEYSMFDCTPFQYRSNMTYERESVVGTPADQWRTLKASSKASSESLAKMAKERRLKRSQGKTPSRSSRESSSVATSRPTTPRPNMDMAVVPKGSDSGEEQATMPPEKSTNLGKTPSRSSRGSSSVATPRLTTPKPKPETTSSSTKSGARSTPMLTERKISRCGSPHTIHPALQARLERFSPDDHPSRIPVKDGSRRSASRPVPGAVRAIAALFDNAISESPEKSPAVLRGGLRTSRTAPGGFPFPSQQSSDRSPRKSSTPSISRIPLRSPLRPAVSESPYKNRGTPVSNTYSPTPRALHRVQAASGSLKRNDRAARTLRETPTPNKPYSSSPRKGCQASQSPSKPSTADHHMQTQPSRLGLGAMTPYPEEPAVDHFTRPTSSSTATSTQSHSFQNISSSTMSVGADPAFERPDMHRHTSGASSYLHAQIRSLQRQLDLRNDEIVHLQRRLDTQDHMDIGTLCEQLRLARRECAMWKKRAESAERRVVVLERVQRVGVGMGERVMTDGAGDSDGDRCGNRGFGFGFEYEYDALDAAKRGCGGFRDRNLSPRVGFREMEVVVKKNRFRQAFGVGRMRYGDGRGDGSQNSGTCIGTGASKGGDGVVFEGGLDKVSGGTRSRAEREYGYGYGYGLRREKSRSSESNYKVFGSWEDDVVELKVMDI
ncbi:hypothetical protein F4808DRAFT_336262 [Astrocystis sublimbata]|nr:hypothetical protein F4808DRAFT_336262 [Astrocystis sublimbata]